MKIKIPFLYLSTRADLEVEALNIRAAVEFQVASGANLSRAYLSGANLSGANLSRANLSRAYLSGANLSRANLSRAYLSGAYLSGANLSGANLSGAYLSGADLFGADLSGAKWNGSITLTQAPIQISIPNYWMVYILDHHMQIGCEIHTFEEWSGFDDRQIKRMSGQALEFWRKYKPMLMAACEARHAKIEKAAE